MPAPYTNTSQNQIQKHGQMFIGALSCKSSAASTLTRNAKGIWYLTTAASLTTAIAADLRALLQSFPAAPVQYNLGVAKNAELGISSVTPLFTVAGAALTLATVGISQAYFPPSGTSATLPTVTDLLAPVAVPLAVNANLSNVSYAPTNNSPLALYSGEIITEFAAVTPAGSTFNFYGFLVNLFYNFS